MASVLEATVSADVRFAGGRLRADFQLCSDGGADISKNFLRNINFRS